MTLRRLGDDFQPWFMECVTTVPFGFFYLRNGESLFAVNGSFSCNPDVGLRRALDILGFEYRYAFHSSGEAALKAMERGLRSGPVIAGPVATKLLSYDPMKKFVPMDSDHYVLVVDVDGGEVILHDPEGFPYVRLNTQEFLESWRAEKVPYKQGSYTMISGFRRKEDVDTKTVYERVLAFARKNLSDKRPRIGVDYAGVGEDAIRQLAADLPMLKPARSWRSMFHFSFPLSSQRCHDVARFLLKSPRHPNELREAAELKLDQSMRYTHLRALVRQKRWSAMSKQLSQIADSEAKFKVLLEA